MSGKKRRQRQINKARARAVRTGEAKDLKRLEKMRAER